MQIGFKHQQEETPWYKIFRNAARSRVGLAWILKGSLSQDVRRDAMVHNFVNSPLVAEALAVREGFYTAANQGISNLWIGSDNLTLIGAMTNKT
ncbi:unnamed protein product [Brassica oleracea]